jgi:hypothetical protein
MWDSPSVVAGEERHSSPVPNDLRGRCPHHSGAGLLRPVIPATCATVSLVAGMVAQKSVSDGESISDNTSVCSPLCRLPPQSTRFELPTSRKPSLLEAGGSASKLLIRPVTSSPIPAGTPSQAATPGNASSSAIGDSSRVGDWTGGATPRRRAGCTPCRSA